MANYYNIKKAKSLQNHVATITEGNWDLKKQENMERCSEKSKKVRKSSRREV